MDWLAKIIEVLKLPLKYFWVILIASSLLLFLPPSLLQRLGLENIYRENRGWIGAVFILSVAMLFVSLGEAIYRQGKRKWLKTKLIKEAIKDIKELDPREKAILREFIIQQQDSIQLPIDQASVAGLLRKGILVQAGLYGERSLAGLLFPVTIRKEKRKVITFDDIDLPANPTDQDIERIRNQRPDFLHEIEEHRDIFHTSWSRSRLFH